MIKIEIPIDYKDAKRRGINAQVSRVLISDPFSVSNFELVSSLLKGRESYYLYLVNTFQEIKTIEGKFESITPKSFEPNACLKFEKKSEALNCFAKTNCEIALLFSCDSVSAQSVIEALGSNKIFSLSNLQPDAVIFKQIESLKMVYSFSNTTNVLEIIFLGEIPIELCKKET